MSAEGNDEPDAVTQVSRRRSPAMEQIGGYAAVRRTTAETIERSRILCEESRLIAEDLAVQRVAKVTGSRVRESVFRGRAPG